MLILKIVSVAILSVIILSLFKNTIPSLASAMILVTGVILTLFVVPYAENIINIVKKISGIKFGHTYLETLIKIVTTAIICDFSQQLCADAGEKYLSAKICFAGKIIMLCEVLPVLISFIDNMVGLIEHL